MGSMKKKLSITDPMLVFRAGKQTDSQGNTKEWTEAELDELVNNFDDSNPPPGFTGHPEDVKSSQPAVAWMGKVWRKGKDLFAEMGTVVPTFKKAFDEGAYRNRSIGLRKGENGWEIDHLAFLGAKNPAVKGLGAFSTRDDALVYHFDAGDVEFNSTVTRTVSGLFRAIRDWLIQESGKDVADGVVNPFDVDFLNRLAQEQEEQERSTNTNADDATGTAGFNEGGPDVAGKTEEEIRADVRAEFQARLDKAEAEARQAKESNRRAKFDAKFAAQVKQGLLTQGDADRLVAISMQLPEEQASFESEGETTQFNATDFLVEFAERKNKAADAGGLSDEQAGEESDPGKAQGGRFQQRSDGVVVQADDVKFDKKVRAYMSEHKVDYMQALEAVEAQGEVA